jgi:hypothetical protein
MIRLAILYFFINKKKYEIGCNMIIDGDQINVPIESGVFQRYVLWSFLYMYYINDIPVALNSTMQFHNRCITFATRSRNVGRKSGKWLIFRTNVTSIEIEIRSNLTTLFIVIHSIHKKKSNILVLQSDKIWNATKKLNFLGRNLISVRLS